MTLRLSPKKIFNALSLVIVSLLILNIIAIVLKLGTQSLVITGIANIFDFDKESNIPSLFSTLCLLISSGLLFCIYKMIEKSDKSRVRWLILSFIFLFLSIDEMASIHEKIMLLISESFQTSGLFFYAWVIPYGVLLLLMLLYYFPFIFKLPKEIMRLFVLSAIIYIAGALGVEVLGGLHHESSGKLNYIYAMLYTLEELLEMIGIAIFIYALLKYISKNEDFNELKIEVGSL